MITDETYFSTGELEIPNAVDGNAGTTSVETSLKSIREKYERLFLIETFGTILYGELSTALDDLQGSDQKWQDLVNGSIYTVDGKSYIWDGLKGKNKDGVIASYIYCEYLGHDEIDYSTVGMSVAIAAKSNRASYIPKYVKIWNQFIDQYQVLDTNPRSLYQYLCDNKSDFPIDDFKMYTKINRFGI